LDDPIRCLFLRRNAHCTGLFYWLTGFMLRLSLSGDYVQVLSLENRRQNFTYPHREVALCVHSLTQ